MYVTTCPVKLLISGQVNLGGGLAGGCSPAVVGFHQRPQAQSLLILALQVRALVSQGEGRGWG